MSLDQPDLDPPVFDAPHSSTTVLPHDEPNSPSQEPQTPSLFIPDVPPSANAEFLQEAPFINIVPAAFIPGDVPVSNNPVESTFYSILTCDPCLFYFVLTVPVRTFFQTAPLTWNTEAVPQDTTFDNHFDYDFTTPQNTLNNGLDSWTFSESDTSPLPPTWDNWGNPLPHLPSYDYEGEIVNFDDVPPSTSPVPPAHLSFSAVFQSPSPNTLHAQPSLWRASHGHSRSEDIISYPPSSNLNLIAHAGMDKGQFLDPPETRINRGHYRRSSAPARSRASHYYPKPPEYGSLSSIPLQQNLPVSLAMERARIVSMPYVASSFGSPPGDTGQLDQQLNGGAKSANKRDIRPPLSNNLTHEINFTTSVSAVSIPNVTTTTTADTRGNRKQADTSFVCPVPGCGSTFTRLFNLKGVSDRLLCEIVPTCCCRPYAFT